MKQNHHITIHLNDGKTPLDTWSQSFEKIPTVGETLEIDTAKNEILKNYQPHAMVSKISYPLNRETPEITLEAVALKPASRRVTIHLNENYVPSSLKREAEDRLRGLLETPSFEWIRSNEARPIVAIHATPRISRETFRKLNNEVRQMVIDASPLEVVG
jgi:hypothetical protein